MTSQASVTSAHDRADITRDLAAPMKDAVAPLARDVLFTHVTPTTAHEVAAVDADRCRVALPPLGVAAEVGRVLVVHEIVDAGRFVVRIHRKQVELGGSLPRLATPHPNSVASFVACNHTNRSSDWSWGLGRGQTLKFCNLFRGPGAFEVCSP